MSSMHSEQFFLKWNNFESNLASGFADLLQKEAMVDVTLAAEGRIVQAHKIILSICSSYFRNMFQVNPCQHPIVVLKDVRYQELTDILDFMYKGEANVRQEDLPSFLKLAETLKIKGLAGSEGELHENFVKRNSESKISLPNLVKDSFREEPSCDFFDKTRKKSKRCSSPLAYTEPKELQDSPKIKVETEECDSKFVSNNINNCSPNAAMKEERLSDDIIDYYGDNNVVQESLKVEKIAGPSYTDENPDSVPQDKTKSYSLLESCFGGHLIVLDGYSYRKRSTSLEKSYWFCCKAKCPSRGILLADGEFQLTHLEHNHKPDFDKIRRKEKLAKLKKLALQLNVSGQDLLEALNIKDDIKKHLGFIRTCRRRNKTRDMPLNSAHTPIYVGLNYKRLPSRVSSKEMLYYSGYYFRQDSKNPQNEKCKYWRCRVKNCKSRGKTDGIGNLTILKPFHNHSTEESEKSLSSFRQTLKLGSSTSQKKVSETDPKNSARKNLENFNWRLKKESERTKDRFVTNREADSVMEDANSEFCFSATNSENFNFEKLMAETLVESFSDAHEFNEAIN